MGIRLDSFISYLLPIIFLEIPARFIFDKFLTIKFLAKPVKAKTKDLRVYKKKKQKLMKISEIKLLFKIIFENLENSKMTISR